MEVAGNDLFADAQRSRVNLESVRKVVQSCRNFEFACRNEELTTEFHTLRVTGNNNWNVDGYRFCRINCEEVCVQSLVSYRVPLNLMENAKMLLALKVKLNDV